jgi:ribosomal protein S18 acetylase RimI-like enzyme
VNVQTRVYHAGDLPRMIAIWNEVVKSGIAFPQEEVLTRDTAERFFAQQTVCGVAEDPQTKTVLGLYVLHPNNVGRCGHICNASYAVSAESRGLSIGEKLVLHSMEQAKAHGFRILQFNAVVETNVYARRLYERLGFVQLGVIPGGFRMPDGRYEAICPYYISLMP